MNNHDSEDSLLYYLSEEEYINTNQNELPKKQLGRRKTIILPNKEDMTLLLKEKKISEIAEQFSTTISTVYKYLRENDIASPGRDDWKLSNIDKEYFCRAYRRTQTLDQLRKRLKTDASRQAIWNLVKKYGIFKDKRRFNGRPKGSKNKPKPIINN